MNARPMYFLYTAIILAGSPSNLNYMSTDTKADLIISSSAFEVNGIIPSRYTCEGKEINPPLKIDNIPHGTVSLAIIAEDPDTDHGTVDHWVVWNIPATNNAIVENSKLGVNGMNVTGGTGYHGPCPPTGSHRYIFSVYALDQMLDLNSGAGKDLLKHVMGSHILAEGKLMGRYEKTKK